MAHHGNEFSWKEANPTPEEMNERLKDVFNPIQPRRMNMDALKTLGATGRFPEGKISDDDEGEILIGITSSQNKVIIDFGKPIKWIGLTKDQAKQIGQNLIDKANSIE